MGMVGREKGKIKWKIFIRQEEKGIKEENK